MTANDKPTATALEVAASDNTTLEAVPDAWMLSQRLARTPFVPDAMRNQPETVLACILTGHEAGLTPMQSLRGIHVIKGRPTFSAETMRALVLGAGHHLDIVESSANHCTVEARRRDQVRVVPFTWTLEEATEAGLYPGKPDSNWRRFPADMLIARATSRACRAMFPDVLAGLTLSAEEVRDEDFPTVDDDPVATMASAPTPTVEATHTPIAAAQAATGQQTATPAPATPAPKRKRPPLPGHPGSTRPGPTSDDSADTTDDDVVVDAEVIEDEPVEADVADDATTPDPFPDAPPRPPEPEPPVDDGPKMTGPQLIAMRLSELGVNASGQTGRAQRLAAVEYILGRSVTTTKDLPPDDIKIVLAAIDKAGNSPELAANLLDAAGSSSSQATTDHPPAEDDPPVDSETSRSLEPTSEEPPPAGEEVELSGDGPVRRTADDWRTLYNKHKVKAAAVLKYASETVGHKVTTVDAIVELPDDVEDWLAEWITRGGRT